MHSAEVEKPQPFEKRLEEQRRYYATEGDKKTFFWVESLRNEAELLPKWKAVKEKAQLELGQLPENVIPQIFERVAPYLETLPTGHSKGHTLRDFISSMELMRDPKLKDIDDVEKIIGIMSGTFHDVGNAVINRYEESKRFSGHAEVGAHLFGELTKDLIPSQLLKLIQYSIAAHTHYTREIAITKKIDGRDETLVRRPYEDAPVDGNRMGIWLARWADRLDMQGIMGFVRHSLTKSQPTEDYDISKVFHAVREDEQEDFKHHFNPVVRSDEQRNQGSAQDKTRNVLEHIQMFRDSALNPSVYSQYDTDFFKNVLIVPAAEEQKQFVKAVLQDTPVLSEEVISSAFNQFYSLCKTIEPGVDIDQTIGLFREKFALLTPEQRSHWANGFNALPGLYGNWYRRMENQLSQQPRISNNGSINKVFIKGRNLAKQSLKTFSPEKLKS